MGARRIHYCNRCHFMPAPHAAICDDCFRADTEKVLAEGPQTNTIKKLLKRESKIKPRGKAMRPRRKRAKSRKR